MVWHMAVLKPCLNWNGCLDYIPYIPRFIVAVLSFVYAGFHMVRRPPFHGWFPANLPLAVQVLTVTWFCLNAIWIAQQRLPLYGCPPDMVGFNLLLLLDAAMPQDLTWFRLV